MQELGGTTNYPVRPLMGGMVLDRASHHLEEGQCRLLENYIVDLRGLRRRPGVDLFNDLSGLGEGEKPADIGTLWTAAGAQLQFLFTDKNLYRLPNRANATPTLVEGFFDEGSVAISGDSAILTPGATNWSTLLVQPGDILETYDSSDELLGSSVITEKTSSLSLTFEDASEIPDGTGLDYRIVRTFDPKKTVSWSIVGGELVIADGKHPLQVYNLSSEELEPYVDQANFELESGEFIARTLIPFNGRLWVANTDEPGGDGVRRQRIRWSTLANSRDFRLDTAFQDFLSIEGDIIRMLPLGESLVLYATDAIYLGTPTNNPELPLRFQLVNTGKRGLLGTRAVTSWLDSHYFVTNDAIYQLSSEGLESIGSAVERDTIQKCENFESVYVVPDYNNDRILFGFPEGASTRISKVWSFSYKLSVWSYDAISTSFLANPLPVEGLSWLDLSGLTWAGSNSLTDEGYNTWRSLVYEAQDRRIYFEKDGKLAIYTRDAALDYEDSETPVRAVFTTKDYDLNMPDTKKYWIRLGLKVGFDKPLGAPLNFTVELSNNRGRSYQTVGTMRIREGFDEGYVTFVKKSSLLRARITTKSPVRPFWIEEIVWKMRMGSHELTGQTATGFSGGGDNP